MLRKKNLLSLYVILLTALFTFLPISALADPITPHGTARFETPNATININNNSSSYKVIWMNAIRAWNNTGAFNFELSTSSTAQIIAGSNTSIGTGYAGLTKLTINNQGVITQADSTLNPKVMTSVGYLPSQETNVAEHELGHAIGLYHSPIKQSVMFAANRFYTIQPADIASVRNLYAASLDATASLTQNTLFQDPFVRQVHSHQVEFH